ncbi:hypothetical protein GCM10022221_65750 [Actinocorallia aurea]
MAVSASAIVRVGTAALVTMGLVLSPATSSSGAEGGPGQARTASVVTTETPEGRGTCDDAGYLAAIFIVGYVSGGGAPIAGDCPEAVAV